MDGAEPASRRRGPLRDRAPPGGRLGLPGCAAPPGVGRAPGRARPEPAFPGCENSPRSGDVFCHRRESFAQHPWLSLRTVLESPLRPWPPVPAAPLFSPSLRRGARTMDSTTCPRSSRFPASPRPGFPLFLPRPPEASVRMASPLKSPSEKSERERTLGISWIRPAKL